MQAQLTIDVRDQLGEAPVWDSAEQRFLWSDNAVGTIREARFDPLSGWRQSRQWNLGRPIAACLPHANGGLVVVGGTEVLLFDEADGKTRPFVSLRLDPSLAQFNEAKCDTRGRLWAGTISSDLRSPRAALYRIDPNGSITTMLESVTISNGLAWSPDDSTFYYIDSVTRSIDAFDFDTCSGTIGNRRSVLTLMGQGAFDGMTIDQNGDLWVAVVGTGLLHCYAPNGNLLNTVATSAPFLTSCTFGGVGRRDLFITHAALRLPDDVREVLGLTAEEAERASTAPGAGGVFMCQPGAVGLPATPFAG